MDGWMDVQKLSSRKTVSKSFLIFELSTTKYSADINLFTYLLTYERTKRPQQAISLPAPLPTAEFNRSNINSLFGVRRIHVNESQITQNVAALKQWLLIESDFISIIRMHNTFKA